MADVREVACLLSTLFRGAPRERLELAFWAHCDERDRGFLDARARARVEAELGVVGLARRVAKLAPAGARAVSHCEFLGAARSDRSLLYALGFGAPADDTTEGAGEEGFASLRALRSVGPERRAPPPAADAAVASRADGLDGAPSSDAAPPVPTPPRAERAAPSSPSRSWTVPSGRALLSLEGVSTKRASRPWWWQPAKRPVDLL